MSGINQRRLITGAYVSLFFALTGQASYFVASFYLADWANRLYFVPALCFGLVIVSTIISVLIEQLAADAEIGKSASSLIKILLVLVILGIFSAVQASSWWRIESKVFAQIVNVVTVSIIVVLAVLIVTRFNKVRKPV